MIAKKNVTFQMPDATPPTAAYVFFVVNWQPQAANSPQKWQYPELCVKSSLVA